MVISKRYWDLSVAPCANCWSWKLMCVTGQGFISGYFFMAACEPPFSISPAVSPRKRAKILDSMYIRLGIQEHLHLDWLCSEKGSFSTLCLTQELKQWFKTLKNLFGFNINCHHATNRLVMTRTSQKYTKSVWD